MLLKQQTGLLILVQKEVLMGEIVAEGTPEDVAKVKKSFTGKFLKDVLS